VGAAKFLEALVDGDLVKAAYVVKLEEGVVAYWPPGAMDEEVEALEDSLSVPMSPGIYFIVGGGDLVYKYVGLVVGSGMLLFRVGASTPAEKLAEKLSRTYTLFVSGGYSSRKSSSQDEARSRSESKKLAGNEK